MQQSVKDVIDDLLSDSLITMDKMYDWVPYVVHVAF